MNIDYKQKKIYGTMYTVYQTKKPIGSNMDLNVAVEIDGYAFPVKNKKPDGVGLYPLDPLCKLAKVVLPTTEKEKKEYSMKTNSVDFSDVKDIQNIIEKQNEVNKLESTMLSNIDNVYKPPMFDTDMPEMQAMKKAIIAKNIDIDSYAHRFGTKSNFVNDKRCLNGEPSITIKKLRRICNALDINATLTLQDKPGVVNPMGKIISVDLTSGSDDIDEKGM